MKQDYSNLIDKIFKLYSDGKAQSVSIQIDQDKLNFIFSTGAKNVSKVLPSVKHTVAVDEKRPENILDGKTNTQSGHKTTVLQEPGITVKSPMVGVFSSVNPKTNSLYINEGDKVAKGNILGTIEVMKTIVNVAAPCDGIVKSTEVEDGQMVEFDQVLFLIDRDDS